MKKLLCLWLNNYCHLDDFDIEKGYLFNDLCINLSSNYTVTCKKNSSSVDVKIEKRENGTFRKGFFGPNLDDVKVLVGENGTGKTTVLSTLFKVLTNKESYTSSSHEFFLVYIEDKKIFVANPRSIKIKVTQYPKELSLPEKFLKEQEDVFSKDLPLFFSPEFKTSTNQLIDSDYRNISTNGYFYRDKKDLIGENVLDQEDFFAIDSQICFSKMESKRIIELLLNAGETFFKLIPIPQMMLMKPTQENIDVGINEAVKLILDDCDTAYSVIELIPDLNNDEELIQGLSESKFLTEDDKKLLSKKINSYIADCYENCGDDVDLKFLFAGMLSCIRTFWSKSPKTSSELSFEIDWKSLKEEPQNTINNFFEKNKSNGIGRFLGRLNKIIDRTQFNLKKDSFIIFDFSTRKGSGVLREVRDIYNRMYYLYPPFSFEFTRPLSSGEKQFISLYSRLYDSFLKAAKNGIPLDSVYLLIDEADVFMHPEWQRDWFYVFVNLIHDMQMRFKKIPADVNAPRKKPILGKNKIINIQLVVSTHSPFMLTDCLNENVVKLRREKFGPVKCIEDDLRPLAGNILDILKTGFFLGGTTGKLTGNKIDEIIDKVQKNEKVTDNEMKFLEYTGNPIMKTLLKRKISQGGHFDKN